MPQVPIYQQQVGGTNAGFQQDLNSDPYGMRVPMNHDIGNGLTQAAKLAKQYQDDLDESFVYDKLSDLRRFAQDQRTGENGYFKLKGENATSKDAAGLGLPERVDQALKDYGNSLQESLTPRQKKLFAKAAVGTYDQQYAFATQHVMDQCDVLVNNQYKARLDTNARIGAQNLGNPDVVNQCVEDVRLATDLYNRRNGVSAEEAKFNIDTNISNLIYSIGKTAVETAQTPEEMVKNVEWLQAEYGKFMNGAQLADLRANLNKAGDSIVVRSMSDAAISELSRDPTTFDIVFNSVIGRSASVALKDRTAAAIQTFHYLVDQESGGRQLAYDEKGNPMPLIGRYADNTMPPLGKRAYGASQMQLKIAEAAAKKAGIEWNPDKFVKDRTYNLQIGQAWMEQLVETYEGDLSKAIVAYHNGETDVNQAVKAAEAESKKTGKPVDWLDKLKLNGGKEYLAAVQKRIKLGQSPEVVGPDGVKLSFFDNKQAQRMFRKVPEKDLREYLKKMNPIFETRPDLLDSTVKAFQAKEDARQQSFVTEQNNLQADIVENYLMQGKSYEDIPENIRNKLTIWQQKEVADMFAKELRGDGSGDEHLAAVLMNDPQQLTMYSEKQMKAMLFCLPKDKRSFVEGKWYALNVKNQVEAENVKRLQFEAAQGKHVDYFSASKETVQGALKLALGKAWPKDSEEQLQLTASMMKVAYDAGVKQGAPFKTVTDLLENGGFKNMARTYWEVQNAFGPNAKKNIFEIKYSDLPDKGRTDVRSLLQGMANNYRQKHNLEGPASEGEVMECFQQLMLSPDADVDLINLPMDSATVEFYQRNFPFEDDREMVRRFVIDALSGWYVKPADTPITDEDTLLRARHLSRGESNNGGYSYDNNEW